MRYCVKCGKQIQESNKFCPYCGHPVAPVEKLEKRLEAQPQQTIQSSSQTATAFKEIQEISFLEKWGSSARINTLMKIYTTIILVVAVILYSILKNADKWAENLLNQENGLETLKNNLQILKIVPFFYYALLIFAIVILVFSIYRFLRNFKGKVHLLYSVGLGISVYEIYHFHDLIDLINQASKYVNQAQTSGLESLFSNDYSSTISTVARIVSNASSYKSTAIILVIVTIALLVLSILSKMQENGKIMVSPWIAMEEGAVSGNVTDITYLKEALTSKKAKKIGITAIVIALCLGGFVTWDKYFNRTNIDVLKNVKLEYDGISGSAGADVSSNKISYKGNDANIKSFLNNDISYSLSKDENISNGDTITVTATYSKSKADELKLNLKDTKKKIKVSGLEHRFAKASDIPSEMLSALRTAANQEINSYYEDGDYDIYKVTYINSWFIKDDDSYSGDKYVACYKIDKTEKSFWDGSTTKSNFFAYASCSDLTSRYSAEEATWDSSSIDDENVTSSTQFQSALADEYSVDEDQVESID